MLAEAEAINADPSHSMVVGRLALFGSLLCAGDGDDVGDVDLAYELVDRPGGDVIESALEEARATAPASITRDELRMLMWPATRLLRRLGLRNSYVSLHDVAELKRLPGARCVIVFENGKRVPLPSAPGFGEGNRHRDRTPSGVTAQEGR